MDTFDEYCKQLDDFSKSENSPKRQLQSDIWSMDECREHAENLQAKMQHSVYRCKKAAAASIAAGLLFVGTVIVTNIIAHTTNAWYTTAAFVLFLIALFAACGYSDTHSRLRIHYTAARNEYRQALRRVLRFKQRYNLLLPPEK